MSSLFFLFVSAFFIGHFLSIRILIGITMFSVFYNLYFWIQLLDGAGYFNGYYEILLAVVEIFTDYNVFLGFADLVSTDLVFLIAMWSVRVAVNINIYSKHPYLSIIKSKVLR